MKPIRVYLRRKRRKRKDPETGALKDTKSFNWYLVWDDPFERYADGKSKGRPVQRSQPIGPGSTADSRKAVVESKVEELQSYVTTGIHPDEQSRRKTVTWDEFTPEHLANMRGRKKRSQPVSEANHKIRRQVMLQFAEVVGGRSPLGTLGKGSIERFVAHLKDNANNGGKQAENTVIKKLVALRAAFNDAIDRSYIDKNPVSAYGVGTFVPKEGHPLTPDEVHRLYQACQDDRMRLFVLLELCTGARLEEVLTLTWDRVEFVGHDKAILTLDRRKVSDRHKVRVAGLAVQLLLKAWRDTPKSLDPTKHAPVDPANLAALVGADPDRQRAKAPWVFTSRQGTRWTGNVLRAFKVVAVRADILVVERNGKTTSDLTIHDFRRTVDSYGDDQGWHDNVTCAITGHDAAIKKSTYSRAYNATLWACAESLASMVAG